MHRPPLSISEILTWADAFREQIGRWPRRDDGKVVGMLGLTWCAADQALRKGHRTLPAGLSLARLLRDYRGVRHRNYLPHFSPNRILGRADRHHRQTGHWPTSDGGPIAGAAGETWLAVDKALRHGRRGLPGGSSLAQFLAEHRGVPNHLALPRLTLRTILAWSDAHFQRTGAWPTRASGPIPGAPGETWAIINNALVQGHRGLAGGTSLARLLAARRGVRNPKDLPRLSVRAILKWAAAYHKRTGQWPRHTSGPIPEAPGESWGGVHAALYRGGRGFPGGSSLYRLLRSHWERHAVR
jgi:hypothetical protein